ncbi:hypothetical protein V2J09_016394 [Rumex salicifolius]
MAAKPSSCFLGHEWVGLALPSPRLLPASWKMRHSNLSSQIKRQVARRVSSKYPERDAKLQPNEEGSDMENPVINVFPSFSHDAITNDEADNSTSSHSSDIMVTPRQWGSPPASETNSLSLHVGGAEKLSSIQLEDLVSMLKNVERNAHLLNEARVHALKHLDNSLDEKEALQSEINGLEAKLAETDARIKVAAHEKIRVEFLEEQLERMRKELFNRVGSEANLHHVNEVTGKISTDEVDQLLGETYKNLTEELDSLRTENLSLKDDIESLRVEQRKVKSTDDQVMMLVKEKSRLETSLKDLVLKFNESHENVTELSTLKVEYKNLWEKVEKLQALLDSATKQADQAILVLQQNQDLHQKVDRLEEYLQEANTCKLSSEKLLQYNELMHQKVNLLEERLERSDEEIQSYFQLYQDSIQDFQVTLSSLKEESKRKSLDDPVSDMPWEFWSQLLLLIDGWLLEKKLSSNDAKILRDLVWRRDRRIYDVYMVCKEKDEDDALVNFLTLTSDPTRSALHIVHIAAEMAPVAKVGGLGDVVTGLGKALQKKGHIIEVILPKYDCMQYNHIQNLRALDTVVESYFDGKLFKNKIWVGTVEGIPVYFIEPLHPSKFFWRGQHYGEQDDFKSRAALELLLQAGKKPDIIHCHDWQTAFVAPLYWDIYVPKGLNSARLCFTCHNFEYQGTAPASELSSCGLDVQQLNRPDRMQDSSSPDLVNPVKGAVVFSNIVTTVSPTYEQEVRTPEAGRGLDGTLNSHSKKFIGILNGIDTDIWNPSTDSFLKVQYSSKDLYGKLENKQVLRKKLGLSSVNVNLPLVGCITRLVPQKGIHLIRHAIYRTLELGGQFVLLGSSPVKHIQREFEQIANQFENHDHIQLLLKYDESLSHTIYAASDMFIIPSIFEPCGLTQMIAMRYGAIPIVRKTGGLNDSVFDIDDDTIPPQFRNGFTFFTPDEPGLNSALDRALHHYKSNHSGWEKLVQKVMNMDFSWDVSASQYQELYSKSIARAARRS